MYSIEKICLVVQDSVAAIYDFDTSFAWLVGKCVYVVVVFLKLLYCIFSAAVIVFFSCCIGFCGPWAKGPGTQGPGRERAQGSGRAQGGPRGEGDPGGRGGIGPRAQ